MFSLNRRHFLATSAGALLAAHLPRMAQAQGFDANDSHALKLWYRQPAQQWVEALPLGNGNLGAMVWGGAARERLQLNEDTLYAGEPYDGNRTDVADALAEVRRLIFAGHYAEAEALANERLMAIPLVQMPFLPLGDLVLELDGLGEINDYRRELDLATATASIRFRAGGVQYRREIFISHVDQCLALRLTADRPGAISGGLSGASELTLAHEVTTAGQDLLMRGRNLGREGIAGGLRFALHARVQAKGGRVQAVDGRLQFTSVDELVIVVAAATSYVRFDDISGDPEAIARERIEAASRTSWPALYQAHLADYQPLFNRVHLDLGQTEEAQSPTDTRVERFVQHNDPALAALYFQFGRYLLIASSRPGSQPPNLQGIWNNLLNPPWGSRYTININLQMNYWPAQVAALPELVEPLERMITELAQTGAKTARQMYNAPGWVAHHNTDLWRQSTAVDGAKWGLWPTGGAWLLMSLWEHWDYGRDLDFLRRVWPLFKGAAEFFEVALQEDPATGELVTNPSLSPENVHPFGASLVDGPAMDSQILRDLFDACIEITGLLDTEHDFARRIKAVRARLPADHIGSAGQLQEWRKDWDMQAPEIHHRHVSHLYALYPSSQINPRDTPELAAAAEKSLKIRGDDATGWGLGWRLNLWARLRDGEHAYTILERLLSPARTYPNLFDAHPPFQIDGNFGGTAGIAEMLMQSWGGSIFLLPALPARWRNGEVRGLRARNTASVDVIWRDGVLHQVSLSSEKGGRYTLVYAQAESQWTLDAGQKVELIWAGNGLRLAGRGL